MRISVIKEDAFIYKDGVGYGHLDLSFLPSNIRAFQWYGTFGEIEFNVQLIDGRVSTPANETVTTEPTWFANVLAAWDVGHADRQDYLARLAAENANAQTRE
jgi:hypothetical protein